MKRSSTLKVVVGLSVLAIVCSLSWGKEFSDGEHMSQIEDVSSFLTPEELLPLCSSFLNRISKRLEKNQAFTPWGGKRSSEPANNRGPERRNENNHFTPWGGKRSFESPIYRGFEKRNDHKNFNPWGGKRRDMSFNGKSLMDILTDPSRMQNE